MVFAGVCALSCGRRCHRRMLKYSQHFGAFARPVADLVPRSQRSGGDRVGLAVPCTPPGQHRRKVVEELLRDRV
jgi:hypothetical protein